MLIALTVDGHVHHEAAESWFSTQSEGVATCPITQGSLVRLIVRETGSAEDAQDILRRLSADPRHSFWVADLDYQSLEMAGVIGHRQVTDAYLAALAQANGGRLATFDKGLAELRPGVVILVPTA